MSEIAKAIKEHELTENALKVKSMFGPIFPEEYEKYGLLEDTDKPYYAHCYNEGEYWGKFCDAPMIMDLVVKKIEVGSDKSLTFGMIIFEVSSWTEMKATVTGIRLVPKYPTASEPK